MRFNDVEMVCFDSRINRLNAKLFVGVVSLILCRMAVATWTAQSSTASSQISFTRNHSTTMYHCVGWQWLLGPHRTRQLHNRSHSPEIRS